MHTLCFYITTSRTLKISTRHYLFPVSMLATNLLLQQEFPECPSTVFSYACT